MAKKVEKNIYTGTPLFCPICASFLAKLAFFGSVSGQSHCLQDLYVTIYYALV